MITISVSPYITGGNMNRLIRFVSLPFFLFALLLCYSDAHGLSEIGKVNENFSYRYLKHEGTNLKGEIINISPFVQKNVSIEIDGYDFMENKLWSTTVHINHLNPNQSIKYDKYVGQYEKRTASLKFKVRGDTSGATDKRKSLAHTSAWGCNVEISGTGPQMSDFFTLREGVNKFNYEYEGTGYFSVKLYKSSGDYEGLVASEIDKIKGSKGINVGDERKYYINVDADKEGKWFIKVDLPLKTSAEQEKKEIHYIPQPSKTVRKTPTPEKVLKEKYKI